MKDLEAFKPDGTMRKAIVVCTSRHKDISSLGLWIFPHELGCHHQKTYIMDDGEGGVVAFVGGINPVQMLLGHSEA